MTLKNPSADCNAKLREIPGVLNIFPGEQAGMFLIECALGRDVRDEIARVVVSHHWGLLELRPVRLSLEDVFLQLTTEDTSESDAEDAEDSDEEDEDINEEDEEEEEEGK